MMARVILKALMATLALSGCSHSEPSASATAAPSAPNGSAATAPAAPSPEPAAVTAGEHPFDAYVPIAQDGMAWMALYYSVSGAPVDYPAAAERFDPTYQRTSDAFAKRDALNAIKPRLDAAIAEAKANPYRRLPAFLSTLPSYDLDHQAYDLMPIVNPDNRLDVAQGEAVIAFASTQVLSTYHPASEQEARQVEQILGSNSLGRQVKVTILGKAVAATLQGSRPLVTFAPARIVIENHAMDGPTTPLFTTSVP
jgi:hypothetical protein